MLCLAGLSTNVDKRGEVFMLRRALDNLFDGFPDECGARDLLALGEDLQRHEIQGVQSYSVEDSSRRFHARYTVINVLRSVKPQI